MEGWTSDFFGLPVTLCYTNGWNKYPWLLVAKQRTVSESRRTRYVLWLLPRDSERRGRRESLLACVYWMMKKKKHI